MSKMPIKWHADNVANTERYLRQRRETVARELQEIEASQTKLDFYKGQISKAESQGLGEFDAERFMRQGKI